jgi:hypothetical protein
VEAGKSKIKEPECDALSHEGREREGEKEAKGDQTHPF